MVKGFGAGSSLDVSGIALVLRDIAPSLKLYSAVHRITLIQLPF